MQRSTWMKDCPKLRTLVVIIEEQEAYKEKPSVKMNSLQLLNVVKTRPLKKANKNERLMYIDAKMSEKLVSIMVDTGTTYNFITLEEAKRVGLNVFIKRRMVEDYQLFT